MDLFKRIQDLSAIYDDAPSAVDQGSRPMFANGQLVRSNADGSRPGYAGDKTYPFKRPDGKTDYRLGLDEKTGKYFKKIGKEDNIRTILQNEGESLEDFKKRKAERVTKVNDATVGARQYVDNWTKNWFDNNLKKYGINSFNVMMDDLSSAWQLQLESGDVPKGKGSFNLSTSKLKLPNITTLADAKGKPNLTPFKYNDVTFYKNLESTDALKNKTLAQFKKVFYKDQINNNPKLQKDLTKFFDFMSSNKQGQYRKHCQKYLVVNVAGVEGVAGGRRALLPLNNLRQAVEDIVRNVQLLVQLSLPPPLHRFGLGGADRLDNIAHVCDRSAPENGRRHARPSCTGGHRDVVVGLACPRRGHDTLRRGEATGHGYLGGVLMHGRGGQQLVDPVDCPSIVPAGVLWIVRQRLPPVDLVR